MKPYEKVDSFLSSDSWIALDAVLPSWIALDAVLPL